MPRQIPAVVLALLTAASALFLEQAAAQGAPEYGPPNGSLVIVGGGVSDEIWERFFELGGGKENGRFVIVPTAGGNRRADGTIIERKEEDVVRSWKERGLKNVRMLHTADPKEADTEAFVEPLLDATAVWFSGGRQWNIVDSYAGTRTFEEFHKVLERGGVVGGSSAGATIQGQYLVRGDTSGPNVMMTEEPNHQNGFAFLKKSAIDQHINARNRWDDLIPVIERYPDLLGIGLSEFTAIVVTGDTFEVIGNWKVAVHDNTRLYQPWEKPYYVLSPGDVYNMKTRSMARLGDGTGCYEPSLSLPRVEVDPVILQEYVGVYQLGRRPVSVRREGSQLYASADGQAEAEIVPKSETDFVIAGLNAPVRFERSDDGEVAAFTIRQNCRTLRAPKIGHN